MPTFDNENQVKYSKENRPFVSVSKGGQLLPEVLQVIDIVAKHQLTLETGHSSAGMDTDHSGSRRRGVQHIVVTHAMAPEIE